MEYTEFKNRVLTAFRLDLNSYKDSQLKRRLDGLLIRWKLNDFGELYSLMTGERKYYEDFLDYLTINVTEFFRDPHRWQDLERTMLSDLLGRKGSIRAWSAACSTGAEPYSLAIVLSEMAPGQPHRLDATDLDKSILETAMAGCYNKDALRNLSRERLSMYFRENGGKHYIIDSIKRMVNYRQHDLLMEKFPGGYDLILCRNVTIYFTKDAQDRINRKLSGSLQPGGILFIGGSEMIFNYQELNLEKIIPCFYRKKL